MFFYLLKNSTIIEQELDENTRSTKILIYGTVAYIILHATLFIGGDDALLNCLKPYFWLFVILDISIITINSEIDFGSLLSKSNTQKSSNNRIPTRTESSKKINNVFDSFLKAGEIDGNERLNMPTNDNQSNPKPIIGNSHIKRKSMTQKRVRFEKPEDGYSSSSDSDIGTDIDLDSFKESLNSF
jgi:hypothetical protein